MFKKLRRTLAIAYALLAGIVLLAVTLLCLHIAESALERATQASFASGVNAILYKLQSDTTLAQSWLAQTETGENQIISIEDAGVPIKFRGAWQPITARETLLARVQAAPEARELTLPLGSLNAISGYFQVMGDHADRYLACVTLLRTTRTNIRLTVLRDMTAEDAQVHARRRTILLLGVIGLILLTGIGWFYSGRAIKPAQEIQARQIEFTAMASHELKAPLAVIAASADALRESALDTDNLTLLDNLTGESMRMAQLVDNLLLLSRSDAGNWHIRHTSVDIDTLLIECFERFDPVATAKGVTLALTLPEPPSTRVLGDAERLAQVLAILVDNAIAYCAAGGHVTLAARANGRTTLLIVEDDGPGIPDKQKARVFDRFYRADDARSDRAHAGLGLAIAREIVQAHAGYIELNDVDPHGARFTVVLRNG